MAIYISEEFSLVALIVVAAVAAHFYMMHKVMVARKKYGVHYPKMYAVESETENAKVFNCIQRGHQNYLEITPFFLVSLVLAGIQHPWIATGAGILFITGRIRYFVGYSSGDPDKRLLGAIIAFCMMMVLLACCVSFTVHQVFLDAVLHQPFGLGHHTFPM